MKTLTALIIDDAPGARSALRSDLEDYCPEIVPAGEAEGVESGEKAIREHKPDVVFLDIQMDDGTGFDLLNRFPQPEFKVIFTTAFDEYAIRAFKFSAVDYLLKPIDGEELKKAVRKLLKEENGNTDYSFLLENIREIHKNTAKKISLNTQEKVHVVAIRDIIRCESHSNYTLFYLRSGENILVTRTLKDYDELLSPYNFLRVHHSQLINLDYLKEFVKSDGGYAVMNDDSQVPVSFRKREALLKRLQEL